LSRTTIGRVELPILVLHPGQIETVYKGMKEARDVVYPELLGFVVPPEYALSTALGYVRTAHLSAPRVTSQVKRPSPSGVMTRRPRA